MRVGETNLQNALRPWRFEKDDVEEGFGERGELQGRPADHRPIPRASEWRLLLRSALGGNGKE